MLKRLNPYFILVLLHLLIALAVFIVPFLSKIYGLCILVFGFVLLLKTKNDNNQALVVCAYVVSSEVFLRMTGGNALHEIAKYEVIVFLLIGIFYKGFSKYSFVYWIFLLLLIPGVIIGAVTLGYKVDVRKAIAFNIMGELTLFIATLYCFKRKVTFHEMGILLKTMILPLVSTVAYLFLYTPSIKDVVTGTQSNFETSGGFGPNQVSTILGLGMFCFFALLLLYSKSRKEKLFHFILLLFVSYRAIVTFSRGGVLTGIIMIVFLLFIVYLFSNRKNKNTLLFVFLGSILVSLGVWTYSVAQTNGLIENRYVNKDARGREKEDRLGGREEIAMTELNMFMDNPILGIGVGKNKEYREEYTGIVAASHNELTRLLAEHGSLGILAILILLITPLVLYLQNKFNFFVLSFYFFWLLTINHAAMRLAAPAFIYALSLLSVTFENKNEENQAVIHRE
ncbi:O-antigen ligase family protein [Flavobacterium sp. J27]|uniref:O-antigen ligase family protein n=1 Tax=Flavobacterium sp. J27 TaxID=2060419 RepID=UPI0010321FD7|nr:O-antigen ligase family protein [Flavobacterium sp. J27]